MFKQWLNVILLLMVGKLVIGGPHTGTYSFNKGINKANATIYIQHFTNDSMFVYITAISGAPEFNTLDFRGILPIMGDSSSYTFKNGCRINLLFKGNMLRVWEDTTCKLTCTLSNQYKKNSTNIKKSSTIVTDFVEKQGICISDSTAVFAVPSVSTPIPLQFLSARTSVKITDEYKQFYLIELKAQQNDFLWVLKKNIQLQK